MNLIKSHLNMLNKNIKRKRKQINQNVNAVKKAGVFEKNTLQILITKQKSTIKRWTKLRKSLLQTQQHKKIQYEPKKRHIKLTAHNWIVSR